jgi:gamma-glutamyltranspeptidase/glutathione hydrolase
MLHGLLIMISPALLFLAILFHLLTGLTTRSFALPSVPNENFGGGNGGQKVRHGAVVSEVDFCSDIGGDMLKKGGNAADAVSPIHPGSHWDWNVLLIATITCIDRCYCLLRRRRRWVLYVVRPLLGYNC